ncbi:MAG: tetratricopeptide repeat protein [Candidatus Delongbacteria bacterium]|nr:tetratricopeptide repeat protein [Candidatus Delongbacteria bacterium]
MIWFERSPDDQIRHLQAVLLKNPDSIWSVYLAGLLFEQNELQDADDLCSDFLKSDPGNIFGRIQLGRIKLAKNELTRAREIFLKLYKDFPDNLVVLSFLADLSISDQQYEQAMAFYEKMMKLDPLSPTIRNQIGQLEERLCKENVQLKPPIQDESVSVLGLDSDELSELKNAFKEIQVEKDLGADGNEAETGDGNITRTLARLYYDQGHYPEAYRMYQNLAERFPEDDEIRSRLEELKMKNHEEA